MPFENQVFGQDGTLSPQTNKVTGDVLVINNGVQLLTGAGVAAAQLYTNGGAAGTVRGLGGAAFSTDGTKIVFSGIDGSTHDDIWIMDADGSNLTRLSTFGYFTGALCPKFSFDGTKIVYMKLNVGATRIDIWVMNVDGTGDVMLHSFGGTDNSEFPCWGSNDKILFVGIVATVQNIYSMNSDGTGSTIITTDASPAQVDFGTPTWNASATQFVWWGIDGSSNARVFLSNADGSGTVTIVDAPTASGEPTALDFDLSLRRVFFTEGEFQVFEVFLQPLGLSFAVFNNTNLVDWSKEVGSDPTVGFDFLSFFVSGYKLRGEGIRKFQSNWVELWGNTVDAAQQFDFTGLFDYAAVNTTGRWTNKQRVILQAQSDAGFSRRAKRLKVRGHGKVLQFRIDSVPSEPFNIEGWATFDTVNQKP